MQLLLQEDVPKTARATRENWKQQDNKQEAESRAEGEEKMGIIIIIHHPNPFFLALRNTTGTVHLTLATVMRCDSEEKRLSELSTSKSLDARGGAPLIHTVDM